MTKYYLNLKLCVCDAKVKSCSFILSRLYVPIGKFEVPTGLKGIDKWNNILIAQWWVKVNATTDGE